MIDPRERQLEPRFGRASLNLDKALARIQDELRVLAAADRRASRAIAALLADGPRSKGLDALDMLERLPSVTYIRDAATLDLIYMNSASLAALGYTVEEMMAVGPAFVEQVMHPDNAAKLGGQKQKAQQLADGEVLEFEYRLRHKSGEWRWFLSRDSVFRRGEGGRVLHLIGTATDITETKRAQEALLESEERYRFIVENTSDAIFRAGLRQPLPLALSPEEQVDWIFREAYLAACNDGMAKMYGYDKAFDIVGKPLAEFVPRTPENEAMEAALVTSGFRIVEAKTLEVDKEGNPKVFLNNLVGRVEDGFVVDFMGTARDITERERAAEALRRAEENYRAQLEREVEERTAELRESRGLLHSVLENTSSSIMLLKPVRNENGTIQDFEYVFTNSQTLRSVNRDSLLGERFLEQYPEAATIGLFQHYTSVMETGIPWSGETRIDFGGLDVWSQVYASKLDDTLLVTYFDISERKQAEQEVLRMKEEVARAAETKYRTLFDSIDEGYFLCEVIFDENEKPIDILYLEANPAAVRLAGRDFTGRRMREIDPNYEEYWYEIIGRIALTGESVRDEHYAAPHGRWFDFYASKVGGQESRRVASIFQDTTERKLRERQQEFLLKLSDALRPLSDAEEIEITACRVLGEWLGAHRVYYVEIFEPEGTARVRKQYLRDGAVSIAGDYTIEAFSWTAPPLRRGEPVIVSDVYHSDLVPPEYIAAMEAVQQISIVLVPLIKEGKWVGVLTIGEDAPRDWKEQDVVLARETLERMWAAAQRARAEDALRESEEKYRTLFDSIDEGVSTFEVVFDENGKPVDLIFIENNPAFTAVTGLPADVIGKRTSEVVPNLEPFWIETYGRVVKTGVSERFESSNVDTDNNWYDVYAARVGEGSNKVVIVYNNITERKRREQQQAFLLKFSDALRAETNADDVANRALRMLYEQMSLDRCYIGVYRLEDDRADLTHQVGNERVPPLPDRIRLSDFPEAFRVVFDRTLVIEDFAQREGLSDTDRRNIGALGLRALVAPCLRKGENNPLWSIVAVSSRPRRWTQGEISLIEEVTERTWAAIERARAEEALQHSEAELRLITDSVPSLISYIDAGERYRFVNAGYEKWFQAPREAIIGRSLAEVLGAAYGTVQENVRRALRGERVNFEGTLDYPQGQRNVLSQYVPDVSATGDVAGFYALVTDISERVAAEETRAWLAALVESSQDAILSFNFDRRVLSWNPGAEKMFGYTSEEMVGASLARIIEKEREGEQLELVERLWRGERITQFETVRLRKSGETFDASLTLSPIMNEQGEIVAATEIIQDVTERKRTLNTLRDSEERLRVMAKSVPAIMWTATPDGVISFNNEQWLAYTGITPEQNATDWARLVLHPDDYERCLRAWRHAIETGEDYEIEVRNRRHDGQYRWFLTRAVPVRDGVGRITSWTGSTTDIHDLKRLEEALREADRRKDEFLAVLAHELRNPLAPIRTSIEIMKRTKDKDIEAEARAVIDRQINHIVRLVDDLLDISRITRGKITLRKEKVELPEIVELALESSRPLIEDKGHRLTVVLPQEKVVLEGDKTRLAQVLLNLLNNAAKYTPPGGEIVLTAEREGDKVAVHVRDTGAGIPHEKLPEVFELFTRLERDRAQEGLGIGLHLVKQIIELHGGEVAAKSPGLEQGSEFTVRLPVTEVAANVNQDVPKSTPGVRRVLVIDDYEPNLRTMSRLLRVLGHEVATAQSGEEGLKVVSAFHPEVILLDLNMPGMNGFEVARHLRERFDNYGIKLVALTGYGQEEDVQRTKETGFDEHLVKPVDVARLEQILA